MSAAPLPVDFHSAIFRAHFKLSGAGDDALDHIGFLKCRGVDDFGPLGRAKRADGAVAIALIALDDLLEDGAVLDDLAANAKLGDASACALLGRGIEKKFQRGIGKD